MNILLQTCFSSQFYPFQYLSLDLLSRGELGKCHMRQYKSLPKFNLNDFLLLLLIYLLSLAQSKRKLDQFGVI